MRAEFSAAAKRRFGNPRLRGYALRYLPLLVVAAAWEVTSLSGALPVEALPPIHLVILRASQYLFTGKILPDLMGSLERAALGFATAMVVGVLIGTLMGRSKIASGLIKPLVALTNPVPKPAFYPLFLIWLGTGTWSTVGVIFTGCIIPITISTFNGVNRVNPHLVWMARNLGIRGTALVWKVILPDALPEVLLGIRIGLTLAWVMLVSAEMLGGQNGLGFLISYIGEAGDYEGMFAIVLIISLIGFISDRAFQRMMDRVLSPYRS